jgi:hypothetical protein
MPNVFSIDVEDWFHLLDNSSAPEYDRWASLDSRVRQNTETLLTELATRRVRCTFFVLGSIAEQYPELVADIARAGHEIASHGYSHTLICTQTPYGFQERAGVPPILYVHSLDIDPDQPRLDLPPHTYLHTYVGLSGCLDKVRALLERFERTCFEEHLKQIPVEARGTEALTA